MIRGAIMNYDKKKNNMRNINDSNNTNFCNGLEIEIKKLYEKDNEK